MQLRSFPRFSLETMRGDHGPQVIIHLFALEAPGVRIESRLPDEEWEFVTIAQERMVIDWHPVRSLQQVEVREYRARYVDWANSDSPWSPIQTIAVAP